MFEYKTRIRLHDTDAAGVLFFANQFKLVHDAYEDLMVSGDMGLGKLLKTKEFIIPIVHAESNYKTPLRPGDSVVIKLGLKKIGGASFTLVHELYRDSVMTGHGETVHACLHGTTLRPIPVPPPLKELLTGISIDGENESGT